jgi:ribose transport system permease protein
MRKTCGSEQATAASVPDASAKATAAARPRFRVGPEGWTTLGLFGLTVVMILGSRLISSGFGSWQQAQAILLLSSFTIVLGFGQGLVILIGGLDLSVGVVMTLGGILAYRWIGTSVVALFWAVPCILLVTGCVGAINGLGVTLLRLPPFIMTLAASLIIYGVFLGFTGGQPRGVASPALTSAYTSTFAGLPVILWLLLIFIILATLLQSYSSFGRRLYAVGTSPMAAYIAGLPVRLLIIAAYGISGVTSGLAGILLVGYATGATLTMGQSYLLPSVAAVVVGGASILGGRATYLATVGGALLLTTLSTIIEALGLAEGWRTVIYGLVIMLALLALRENLGIGWARMPRFRNTASRSGPGGVGRKPNKTGGNR